jgi:diguanylate cyclase (GGDEF)-like protein
MSGRARKLAVFILLPMVVAIATMLWSTFKMLDGISASVDSLENERTWQAVHSAVTTTAQSLGGIMKDNAQWDDAVSNIYAPLNDTWLRETWGTATADTNYNFLYILDAKGNRLTAYENGSLLTQSSQRQFGSALPNILSALPSDKITFSVVTSLIDTPNGLAAIAAAPILPQDSSITIPAEKPNILIFGRYFTPPVLSSLSTQFIVDNLQLQPVNNSSTQENVLNDHWGNPVASAHWQARHPGDAARQNYSFSSFALLIALLGAMFPISWAHFKMMSNLEDKELRALFTARHDGLSGIPNRSYLIETLNEKLPVVKPHELALIYIDLDGFKSVNDTYGHEGGDMLICSVTKALNGLVNNNEFLARLGGDEFAILITDTGTKARAEILAQEIIETLSTPFSINGRIANVGASIGIATYETAGIIASELMRQSDIAMYSAKEGGRNRFRHFDVRLDHGRHEETEIAAEIQAFIDSEGFTVAFQPIVDSASRNIVAVEALARWPKSSCRKISPDVFIRIAEENGLIDSLGFLIMRTAFKSAAQWKNLRLAVNVSPIQLYNKTFSSDISKLAAATNFDLKLLEVEFTESMLIKNPARAKQVITELKSLGIKVALDDFGTGYASVGYLREFSFDRIKLDRSLTQKVLGDISTQQVVQGTVLIAKGLSAQIVAEGVETEEEAKLMHLTGCNYMQGYYFGKPQDSSSINNLLRVQNEKFKINSRATRKAIAV